MESQAREFHFEVECKRCWCCVCSVSDTLLRNAAEFVDKVMELDEELCTQWSCPELVLAIMEAVKQIGYHIVILCLSRLSNKFMEGHWHRLILPLVFAARCYASAASAVMHFPSIRLSVCLSVRLSVTFVHSVKISICIFRTIFTVE